MAPGGGWCSSFSSGSCRRVQSLTWRSLMCVTATSGFIRRLGCKDERPRKAGVRADDQGRQICVRPERTFSGPMGAPPPSMAAKQAKKWTSLRISTGQQRPMTPQMAERMSKFPPRWQPYEVGPNGKGDCKGQCETGARVPKGFEVERAPASDMDDAAGRCVASRGSDRSEYIARRIGGRVQLRSTKPLLVSSPMGSIQDLSLRVIESYRIADKLLVMETSCDEEPF